MASKVARLRGQALCGCPWRGLRRVHLASCTLRFPRREPVACFARLGRSNGKQWRAIFAHFCWLRASRRARRTEYAMRSWPGHPFGPRRTRRTLSVLVGSVTPPSLRAVVRMRLPSALYGTTAHCTMVVRADAALGELDGVEDSVARHSNFAVSTFAWRSAQHCSVWGPGVGSGNFWSDLSWMVFVIGAAYNKKPFKFEFCEFSGWFR